MMDSAALLVLAAWGPRGSWASQFSCGDASLGSSRATPSTGPLFCDRGKPTKGPGQSPTALGVSPWMCTGLEGEEATLQLVPLDPQQVRPRPRPPPWNPLNHMHTAARSILL